MNDFDTFTKLPKNVWDLGKLIVAKRFKKSPKVQKNRPRISTNLTIFSIFLSFRLLRLFLRQNRRSRIYDDDTDAAVGDAFHLEKETWKRQKFVQWAEVVVQLVEWLPPSRNPWFESSHQQTFIEHLFNVKWVEKTK